MKNSKLSRAALVAAGIGALVGAVLSSPATAAGDGTQYYKVVPTCATASSGHAQCLTLQRIKVAKGAKGAVAEPTVSDAGPAGGFTPGNLASAYAVNANTATPGQVVGIVDAHDNPAALSDLNAFDAQYGLPAETASSFQKIGQDGGAPPTNTSPPTDEELGGPARSPSISRRCAASATPARSCWSRRTPPTSPTSPPE